MKYFFLPFTFFICFNTTAQNLDTLRILDLLDESSNARAVQKYDSMFYYSNEILEMEGIMEREDFFIDAALLNIDALWYLRDLTDSHEKLQRLEEKLEMQNFIEAIDRGFLYMARSRIRDFYGDLKGSSDYLLTALTEFSKVNTLDAYVKQGNIYNNLGINATRMLEFDLASDYFQQSLTVYDSLQNEEKMSSLNNNLGNLYQYMGSYDLAAKHYQRSLEFQKKNLGELHLSLADSYTNLAALYGRLGQSNRALEYNNMVLRVARQNGKTNSDRYVRQNLITSQRYISVGDLENALERIVTAEEVMKDVGKLSPFTIALYEYIKGLYYTGKGETEKGIYHYKRSIPLFEPVEDNSTMRVASVKTNLGEAYASIGELDDAIDYSLQAVEEYKKIYGLKSGTVAANYGKVATWYGLQGDFSKSMEMVDKSISATVNSYKNGLPDLNGIIFYEELIGGLHTKANLLRAHYLTDGNIEHAQKSLQYSLLCDSVVRIKQERGTYSDQLNLLNNYDKIYDNLVTTYYDFYSQEHKVEDLNQAFYFANRGNNVLLRHHERKISDQKFGRVPEEIVAGERQLKEEISNIKGKIFELEGTVDSLSQERLHTLKNRLFNKNRQLDSLTVELRKQYPTYYNFMYATEMPTLNEVAANMDRGSSYLQYITTIEGIYVFKIHNGESHFFRLETEDDFDQSLKDYLLMLSRPKLNSEAEHLPLAIKLYDQLIRPVGALNEQLIILVDGALNKLPFETLADSSLTDTTMPYLLGQHNVSYLNNINQLTDEKPKPKLARQLSALAMAPDYSFGGTVFESESRTDLGKLIWTVSEAQALGAMYDTEIYTHDKATESAFKNHSKDKNILHIASHALLNGRDPLSSRIIFESDTSDSLNDGSLFVHELYNLSLDADLVVLSACSTGAGELANGEGILSLGRGFQYAGVRSVVLSHWQVNDQSTNAIMAQFHQNLVEGQTKSEALRNAKLEYISNASNLAAHPFFWGAFVVIGDDAPLTRQSNWYLYAILLFGMAVILGIARRRKNQ